MVDILNGADKGPLAGYVIAQTNGLTLLGLLTGRTLSPVYDLKAGMQQGPGGSINISHACFPVLLFGSLDEIDLPEGALTIPITSLSRTERAALRAVVENGEKMAQAMRAAAAGVTLATTMPAIKRP
jgi:hypothetical protein